MTSAWVSPWDNTDDPWVRGSTLVRIEIGRTLRVPGQHIAKTQPRRFL
jgi:hypothetical protein